MYPELYTRIDSNRERMMLFPASRALFVSADGKRPIAEVGEIWRNPDLADTFQLIAEQGIETMYNGGVLGQDIMNAVAGVHVVVTAAARITLPPCHRCLCVSDASFSAMPLCQRCHCVSAVVTVVVVQRR
jgi:hypothetical protein